MVTRPRIEVWSRVIALAVDASSLKDGGKGKRKHTSFSSPSPPQSPPPPASSPSDSAVVETRRRAVRAPLPSPPRARPVRSGAHATRGGRRRVDVRDGRDVAEVGARRDNEPVLDVLLTAPLLLVFRRRRSFSSPVVVDVVVLEGRGSCAEGTRRGGRGRGVHIWPTGLSLLFVSDRR